MKMAMLAALCFLTMFAPSAKAQEAKRIILTDNSNVTSSDLVTGLQKKCPNVSLTANAEQSDYRLEAIRELKDQDKNGSTWRYKFTLFDKDGAALLATSTRRVDNAVKDICSAINHKK
jgi:hypothetical protein